MFVRIAFVLNFLQIHISFLEINRIWEEMTMPEPKKIQAQVSLDDTDLEILRLLSTNGRLSNSDLASQVGLAPSTCLVRVRRLVDEGVIRSFSAEVSPPLWQTPGPTSSSTIITRGQLARVSEGRRRH
ncbi:MAG: winged helix-turn-helix transcriptional regulator [Actinobacteria bacterium]|nr:winged helix-turn-helix transcriptional regulator [Actinomycetota bacterium]